MRLNRALEIGPSTLLGINNCLDIGRTEFFLKKKLKSVLISNQLRLRHTFASQKMRTQSCGQRALWTPYLANTPTEVLNESH